MSETKKGTTTHHRGVGLPCRLFLAAQWNNERRLSTFWLDKTIPDVIEVSDLVSADVLCKQAMLGSFLYQWWFCQKNMTTKYVQRGDESSQSQSIPLEAEDNIISSDEWFLPPENVVFVRRLDTTISAWEKCSHQRGALEQRLSRQQTLENHTTDPQFALSKIQSNA